MSSYWFIHLLLSLVIGGAFIAFCSLAAEFFGTEFGGLIAGLPSTVVITLLLVALTESPSRAVEETTIIPVILGLNCLFLVTYALGAAGGAVLALAAALVTWLALAVLAVLYAPRHLATSLLLLVVGFGVAYVLLNRCVRPATAAGSPVRPGALQVLARAAFGGAVIALGVWLSHTGGPIVGGVAAVFPAAGVSTLVIVSWSRGVRFSLGLLQPMMVSGSITILVYAAVVRYTYLPLGVFGGTMTALVAAGGSAYVLYRWRQPRGRGREKQ
jgi:uncharacterized membrane protein (GlpM family)